MQYEFGFIGCGNMGGALASAARKTLAGDQIILANRTREKAERLAEQLDVICGSNEDAAVGSRFIFLGVKPQNMAELLASLAPVLGRRSDRFVLVTMAAGVSIAQLRAMAGSNYPVIRIMPNMPVSVGAGMIQYAASDNVSAEEKADFAAGMACAGLLDELDEKLIDAGSAVSGCGPAFADLFIEALADAGVEIGLPRAKALRYAAQMVMGSAKMVLESGKHPGALKDEVCSPGGSTIVGVHALENGAFRGAVMNAVAASYAKSLEMGKAAGESAGTELVVSDRTEQPKKRSGLDWLFR